MAARAVAGNLPAELTSFVGRRRESAAVRRLLTGARLVTLTGVGGTGKTRLALRVAAQARRAFADGAWFVDLTEVGDPTRFGQRVDPDILAGLVLATFGLPDRDGAAPMRQLTEHLADRRVLLVLDNCEHLLPGCSILATRLLRACPGLAILATTREPLMVDGEVVFSVPPMPIGRPDAPDPEGAVTLFVDRARAVTPGFEVTADNRAAVIEICHRLDGLPLAIELAAARAVVLGPGQIAHRLAERFALLRRSSRTAPARQQTLRACIDWSYELCEPAERTLWARLSVFVGGFELDAVEGVCGDETLPAGDLLDVVASLVHKSIIDRDDDDSGVQARYRMLASLRDYGHERLVAAGELGTLRRRHRDWYRRLVDRAKVDWISERQEYWITRLNREHPNLRAAVEFSLAEPGEAESAMHIAVNLPGLYWWTGGLLGEGRRWLDLSLAAATAPTGLRAQALLLDAQMAFTQQQDERAERLLAEGEALARRLDTPVELALAAFERGVALLFRRDVAAAIRHLERSREILAAVPGHEPGLPLELRLGQLNALGIAAGQAGDGRRADAYIEELLAVAGPRAERRYRSLALWTRAMSVWTQGRVDEAEASLRAGLRLAPPQATDLFGTAQSVEGVAWVAAARRRFRRAATLLGVADALATRAQVPLMARGHLVDHHDRCVRTARAALGDRRYQEAFRHGQELSYADALAYARDEEQARPVRPASEPGLTRREREVAGLIAEGLSNREIAARLVISPRTVESHVEHILAKLGCTGRSQVAAWVAGQARDA